MSYWGDFVGTETIPILFTTVQATGAPTTLAGTPRLRCYKAGNTTESSDITPSVDFDGRTGLNLVSIDLTGDSSFYATGNDFSVVITAGTVNSVSVVGYVVAEFSILKRSPLRPTTAGRTLVVDASGLADANAVKVGPSGSGTAQTARDIGASVLLSAGSGTGQLDFTSGVVKANLAQILGTALTETAGLLAGGFKKFFNIATPAATMDHGILVDTVTTATTATNLTNAPTAGDFTAAMKTSIGTAVAASAVASVTGNVGGNVTGSVGSIATGGIAAASFAAGAIDAAAIATDAITSAELAASAVTEIAAGIAALSCTEPTAVVAAAPTLIAALSWLLTLSRNKITQTATDQIIKADDASTTIATAAVSDDGVTFVRGEFA